MNLREAVQKYAKAAGGYGRPLALAAFGLSTDETEKIFSVWDEDYQISRFMELTLEPSGSVPRESDSAQPYRVNGFECSHVRFHPDIERMLTSSPSS